MLLDHSPRKGVRIGPGLLRSVAAAVAAATLTLGALPANARPVSLPNQLEAASRYVPSPARAFAGALTLDEAVAQAEKRYNAKVVKAETHQEGGKTIYELRLLSDDGRVWTIRVDAATGAGL